MFKFYLSINIHCQGKNILLLFIIHINCSFFKVASPTCTSNWNELGLQNTRRRKYLFTFTLPEDLNWHWPITGKPRGEYESMTLFREALQMDSRRKVKSSSSCFSGNACYSQPIKRPSHGCLPWDGQCFLAEVLGGRELSLHFFLCCKWRNGVAGRSEKTKEKIDNRYNSAEFYRC